MNLTLFHIQTILRVHIYLEGMVIFFYRKLIYSYDKIVLPLCELFNTKKYYFNVQQVYNLTSLTYSYLYL